MKTRSTLCFVLIHICWVLAVQVAAQPAPQLDSLYPKGIQKGKIVSNGEAVLPVNRITLYGKNFWDVSKVMVSGGGVESIHITERHTGDIAVNFSGRGVSGKVDEGHRLVVEVTLSPDADMNTRQVRVVTPNGVSNPLPLIVNDLNEIYESEPNNSLLEPQNVDIPLTINAVISSNDDVDVFRFDAKKGQRIFCEVNASRIGSPLDSFIVLYDEDGNEAARNDVANGLDSLIDYEVKKTGAYRLSVRDLRYKGGGNYFYRLRLGELPYLDAIFPLGGRRGEQSTLTAIGKNLGGIGDIQFAIAPDAPLGIRNIRLTPKTGMATNPVKFDVDDVPEVAEDEGNNTVDTAQRINLPVTINGRMNQEDDIDRFAFDAKQGQRYSFEVLAKRLGSNLDGFLQLFDGEGNSISVNDDTVGVEALINHRFDKDGRYQIAIRDLSNQGGDDYAYRLKIHPPQQKLSASVSPDNPRITPGGSVPLQFSVARQGGISGAVNIIINGLPDGITASPGLIAANQSSTMVSLNAGASVKPGLYKISAVVSIADGNDSREISVSPNTIYLTVVEQSFYSLKIVDVIASVDQSKSTQIKIQADRRGGFTAPVQLQLVGPPGGVNANQPVIPENRTETVMNLSAENNASVGQFFVSVRGESSVNNEPVEQYSSPIPLTVHEAPFTVDIEPRRIILPLSAPAANKDVSSTEEVELSININRKGFFTGLVDIVPNNVPEKMNVITANAQPGTSEVKIKVSAGLDIKPDTYTLSFTCRSDANGKVYEQRTPGVSIKLIQSESIE